MKKQFAIIALLLSAVLLSSCGANSIDNASSYEISKTAVTTVTAVSTASSAAKTEKTTKSSKKTEKKETKKTTAATTKKKKKKTTSTTTVTTKATTKAFDGLTKEDMESAKYINDKFFQYIKWRNLTGARSISVGTVLKNLNDKGNDYLKDMDAEPVYEDDFVMNFEKDEKQKIIQIKYYINGNEKNKGTLCYSTIYCINGQWLIEGFDYMP